MGEINFKPKQKKNGAVIVFPRKQRPVNFERIAVLISSLAERRLAKSERVELGAAISSKIDYLEQNLAGNASGLVRAVESFVRAIAGDREDVISGTGIVFRNGSSEEIRLKNGEAAKESAKEKIERIIEGSAKAAQDDLIFLKQALETIRESGVLPENDLIKLREVIENNTYWRFIDVV
jgi:hypothetical protein